MKRAIIANILMIVFIVKSEILTLAVLLAASVIGLKKLIEISPEVRE